jgi:hypothetical protein
MRSTFAKKMNIRVAATCVLIAASLAMIVWVAFTFGQHLDLLIVQLCFLLVVWWTTILLTSKHSKVYVWRTVIVRSLLAMGLFWAVASPASEDITAFLRVQSGRDGSELGPRHFWSERSMPGDGFAFYGGDLHSAFFATAIWLPVTLAVVGIFVAISKLNRPEHSEQDAPSNGG